MVEFWECLIALLVGLFILQYLNHLWASRNYPPGPFQLPLIGGIWCIGSKISHDTLIKLAKRYGNIYTVWLGQKPVVVLSGYQAVKEGMIDRPDDFGGRPVTAFVKAALDKIAAGVIFSNGNFWKQHRRFALVTLRKMGMGRQSMENQIEEEAQHLVKTFASTKGQPFEPFLPITNAVCNVISGMAFGIRYSVEDEEFQRRVDTIDAVSKYGTSVTALLYETLPWLMNYVPGPHHKIFDFAKKEISFTMGEIEKHKEERDSESQDIVDYYLLQMEKNKSDPRSTYNRDNLAHFILDLFIAGTETSATSLHWALLLMMAYPDIQDKVYKEMEEVLGSSESICCQDQKKLPYTNAVIHEVLRAKYVFFFGLPRECVKDVKLRGFHIPKGTFIIPDLHSVLHDPERWETPEEFNPHHFLDKEGNFKSREEFLPFGIGARVCLGEQMAKKELFLFFTHLLRTFKFQLPEGVKELNKEPLLGFMLHPHPYRVCAVPRCSSSETN
ncbi:cytochrome P450 2J2-like [Sceloporus undulatus]|uniref:cytochrome P450 2J2-like n=1 Tax=Sceloporus undulatus TaxID=8520 RepID=UPI001C4C592C|nr:cytochrome P450 2J2-like [Sceloporus undulatus]